MKRLQFLKTAGLGAFSGSLLNNDRDTSPYKNLKKPKKLKRGGTVAFSAPAGILFNMSDFDKMERVMDSFGMRVKFGEFVKQRFGYFSGTDYQRALDLNRFFSDPDIDAIVAVRGGWGCSRILPHLDFQKIKENPKILCGFSDITTLHLAILNKCGLVTFHGPNGASDWTDLTLNSFESVLIKGEKSVFLSKSNVYTIMPGKAEGPLIGGNLSILTTSLGTPYQPDTSGCILYIEDIGEPVYKIDRMLTHLKAAGLLDNLSGLMFGQCTNCPAPSGANFTRREIFEQHIKPLGIPAVIGVDIGHDPDNFTIPVGIPAILDANDGVFKLNESAVI